MSNGRKILLIDDSTAHGYFIRRARVCLDSTVSLVQHVSGEDGLAHLNLCPDPRPMPDLVLLDRNMPGGMDGFATLRAIHALVHLHHLAVLMLCGSDDPEHIAQAEEDGADGYVVKPYEQARYGDLARQVQAWMSAREASLKIVVPSLCAVDAVPVRRIDNPAASMDHPASHSTVSYRLRHLSYAAEKVELDLALLLDLSIKDNDVREKRRYFVWVLLEELRWPGPAVKQVLNVSKRYLQECRNLDPALLPCASGARLLK